ncbi:cytochrome c oxidase copper chaperone [Anastrepha ludens]|uniref:cytochrome c oxidase copper chaperone n=1 Tax=Anastrepha ludens TaxID=28586 RepID=UPI0023B134CB|nr:cytochrome c oxidase copper chaperone [Anastrepha ludens]XP_053951028.1 cytochrome c oxidase copper chaperone [Anastrepha ludens]
MGNAPVKEVTQAAVNSVTGAAPQPAEKPKCKACCACPDTKKARDACIVERGEENCTSLIEAHKQCMRAQGFNI